MIEIGSEAHDGDRQAFPAWTVPEGKVHAAETLAESVTRHHAFGFGLQPVSRRAGRDSEVGKEGRLGADEYAVSVQGGARGVRERPAERASPIALRPQVGGDDVSCAISASRNCSPEGSEGPNTPRFHRSVTTVPGW
ncbi:hypothetical protein [Nonomuraea fuscirosea]|uniref:hypothetical protein n=1 Tax=Nonomuraea fuscirosea TaxID=1291556 RepID=UPI003CCBB152